MTPTKVLIGQILVVFGIVAAGTWSATQWTAAALGHQARLGTPWFDLDGVPVYLPWRFFEWWYAYEAYAPDVFMRGGGIAAGSGVLAALAAICGSVWRAKYGTQMTHEQRIERLEAELRALRAELRQAQPRYSRSSMRRSREQPTVALVRY